MKTGLALLNNGNLIDIETSSDDINGFFERFPNVREIFMNDGEHLIRENYV